MDFPSRTAALLMHSGRSCFEYLLIHTHPPEFVHGLASLVTGFSRFGFGFGFAAGIGDGASPVSVCVLDPRFPPCPLRSRRPFDFSYPLRMASASA
jgi:hypothetical protein